MKKMTITALALALAFTAGSAAAASKDSYTFVEAGLANLDVSDAPSVNGAYLRGSYDFGSYDFGSVYTAARVTHVDTKISGVKVKLEDYDMGLGLHRQHGKANFFGEAAYQKTKGSAVGLSSSGDGYRIGAGVKADLAPKLEGLAQVNYRDGDSYESETSGVLGLHYAFAQNWSVSGTGEFGDQTKLYNLGVRYGF